jgi:hypothetical protein
LAEASSTQNSRLSARQERSEAKEKAYREGAAAIRALDKEKAAKRKVKGPSYVERERRLIIKGDVACGADLDVFPVDNRDNPFSS